MNSETLLTVISAYSSGRNKIRQLIQEHIKDKQYSLEDRWNVFKAATSAMILPEHSYIQDIDAMGEVSWYDDFYKDRYALVEWVDVVESIEDNGADSQFYTNLDAIKEEILEAGYFGFTYDW